MSYFMLFQSTPPMQGATSFKKFKRYLSTVSIHAPYAGSDVFPFSVLFCRVSFNPRPLCRERPSDLCGCGNTLVFQSTPPMQGATIPCLQLSAIYRVSIHAPYAGSDDNNGIDQAWCEVSIHAPYAGSDLQHLA